MLRLEHFNFHHLDGTLSLIKYPSGLQVAATNINAITLSQPSACMQSNKNVNLWNKDENSISYTNEQPRQRQKHIKKS